MFAPKFTTQRRPGAAQFVLNSLRNVVRSLRSSLYVTSSFRYVVLGTLVLLWINTRGKPRNLWISLIWALEFPRNLATRVWIKPSIISKFDDARHERATVQRSDATKEGCPPR